MKAKRSHIFTLLVAATVAGMTETVTAHAAPYPLHYIPVETVDSRFGIISDVRVKTTASGLEVRGWVKRPWHNGLMRRGHVDVEILGPDGAVIQMLHDISIEPALRWRRHDHQRQFVATVPLPDAGKEYRVRVTHAPTPVASE